MLGDWKSLEAASLGGNSLGLSLGLGCGVKIRVPSNSRTSLDSTFLESSSGTQDCPSGDAIKGFQNQAGHSFPRGDFENSSWG